MSGYPANKDGGQAGGQGVEIAMGGEPTGVSDLTRECLTVQVDFF